MIITKKALPRRTFLKTAQAALALPLLDAMIPAMTALAQTPAKAVRRLGFVFIPMGCDHARWTPEGTGALDQLSPILSPLEPVKEQLTVVTNMELQNSYPGTHDTSNSGFLSAAFAKHTESSDYFLGTTADQVAAKQMGQETQLRSLELSMDRPNNAGACTGNLSCVYTHTLSWRSPTQPLPTEWNPRTVFETLFGDSGSTDRAAREARLRQHKSLLDSVADKLAALRRELGPRDQTKVEEFTEAIRDVERRIQKAEEQRDLELPSLAQPQGAPPVFEDHLELMFDLQVLAFETDITRVFSFKLSRDATGRVYPESGIDRGFHPTSHHGGREENIETFARLNRYHVGLVPYFLDKLQRIEEGDGTLLDKSMIIYGSPMGNSNVHNHKRCPLFLAGHANGQIKGNVHIITEDRTPMANVMLTLLHKLGLNDLESFGDSTGTLAI